MRRGFGASNALVERNLLAAGSRVQRDTLAYLCALANARWNAGYNALQAHTLTRVSCAFIRLTIRAILREPTRVELAWQTLFCSRYDSRRARDAMRVVIRVTQRVLLRAPTRAWLRAGLSPDANDVASAPSRVV